VGNEKEMSDISQLDQPKILDSSACMEKLIRLADMDREHEIVCAIVLKMLKISEPQRVVQKSR